MSNLGIKEIKIPSNLTLNLKGDILYLESDFGKLNYTINPDFNLEIIDDKYLKFYPKKISKDVKKKWGTYYSLLKNCIDGLSQGYTKILDLIGVGFKATLENNSLVLKLGYSHEVNYPIPSDVIIQCPKQDKIIIFGINKQRVNEIVSSIQSLKKIDPYKGKGILLEGTKLRLKEGKKK